MKQASCRKSKTALTVTRQLMVFWRMMLQGPVTAKVTASAGLLNAANPNRHSFAGAT